LKAARDAGSVSEETQILAYTAFERQMDYLQRLAGTLRFDLSMIVIRAENPGRDRRTQGRQHSWSAARGDLPVAAPFGSAVRVSNPGGLQYCLLLPGTAAEKAAEIAARLGESLQGPAAERIARQDFRLQRNASMKRLRHREPSSARHAPCYGCRGDRGN